MNFKSPFYDKKKPLAENVEELFGNMAEMSAMLNAERSTKTDNIIFANGGTSGTVTVPLDSSRYRLLIAVVGGKPRLCALYKGKLNGDDVSGTIAGTTMTYSASGTLDALIAII